MKVKQMLSIFQQLYEEGYEDYEVLVNHNMFVNKTYHLTSNYYVSFGKQVIVLQKEDNYDL